MRLDPPLDPTSAQAREWLEAELRKGVYQEDPGLLQRLWDWLMRVLDATTAEGGLPAWTIWLAVLLGAAVVALVVARSVRAEQRMTRRRPSGVLDGPIRAAAEHRAAASAALAAGDADTALLEAYRAIARSAVERTLLDDLPGRTAHEVSVALVLVFPAHAGALALAADAFDAVRYGRRPATPDTARAVIALDAEIAQARPILPEPTGRSVTP